MTTLTTHTPQQLARLAALRQRASELAVRYVSLEALEANLQANGLSPDDHTRYTDLLEWRAVRHELADLMNFLEMV